MKLIDFKNINEIIPPSAATIGFFDGLHKGHKFLLNQLVKYASSKELKSMVITFGEHPNKFLQSQPTKKLLTTFDEKIEILSELNIDYCVVLDFTQEISKLSAADFMRLIHTKLSVDLLFVGYDHRFGHNRLETFDDYKKYGNDIGMQVIQIQPFIMGKGLDVSSSKIRHLIEHGNIETANNLLGYNYFFSARVVHGLQIGSTIGFPTANLKLPSQDKVMPIQGAYYVNITFENNVYDAMMNIGYNPTRGSSTEKDPVKTIEVNIFEFSENIYDNILKISFFNKIRDEIKFTSMECLKQQLIQDKQQCYAFRNQKRI
ncbi:MAG: bifunctional riboflavin kinase/FAD synthetase [Paludibacter sp.]|nr:bifunctional riboflavin kinase/FAD synthetase [Paludibacter sp.]